MTTQAERGAVKKRTVKKAKVIHGEDIELLIDPTRAPPVSLQKKALVYEVDGERERWAAETGMPASNRARIARHAAKTNNTEQCKWCGAKKKPLPDDILCHFHEEYKDGPMCVACTMPLRKQNHVYMPNWMTDEGQEALIKGVMTHQIEDVTPVYQIKECNKCKRGPVIVRAGEVVMHLEWFLRHRQKSVCLPCHVTTKKQKIHTQNRGASKPSHPTIATPVKGPEGQFNRIKHRKDRHAPSQGATIPEASLPPITAFEKTTEASPT